VFFVLVCNLILSYKEGRRMTDEGQRITALLRTVTERPNFAFVEEDVPISKHIIKIRKNKKYSPARKPRMTMLKISALPLYVSSHLYFSKEIRPEHDYYMVCASTYVASVSEKGRRVRKNLCETY
jgi:hypothetical protein